MPSTLRLLSFRHPTKKDRKYPASNWGTRIALAAPGEKILSTMTSDSSKDYQSDKEEDGYNYTYLSGTHQAAAYVAGTAACMLSKKDSLKPEQIRWILRASSDDANSEVLSGWDLYFGDGRLNAKEALKR